MARLRVGDIGSISAWLPSRRSVESQRGAVVMLLAGQVRSGGSTGLNGTYRWHGMPLGCCRIGDTGGYALSLGIVACFLRGVSALGFDGGQRTCLGPATREPAFYRPPPRPLRRSSSYDISIKSIAARTIACFTLTVTCGGLSGPAPPVIGP